jgi:hypothetical protein
MLKDKKSANDHKIQSVELEQALLKANLPSRYRKQMLSLDNFTWGRRMKAWIKGPLLETEVGKGAVLTCNDDAEITNACCMLVRSLILLNRPACFYSLPELVALPMAEWPKLGALVIAGFYDNDFNKKRGSPMSSEISYNLSWALRRFASDGNLVVANIQGPVSLAANWWHSSLISELFNHEPFEI